MSKLSLTNQLLSRLQPKEKPYFIRDSNLKGFGVKVNRSGSIKFIAELKYRGVSKRKTLGEYPMLGLPEARTEALSFLSLVRTGNLVSYSKGTTIQSILDSYITRSTLKERTIKDYREAICYYLSDWLNIKVSNISKRMVEQRFYKIRDRGINGGIPTYSQATKTMRILSALMNYAMADEMIQSNPVDILKQKRIKRGIIKKTEYLTRVEARQVLETLSSNPTEQAVALMLFTGLRKTEALSLTWSCITEKLITIKDTKNHREHLIPITKTLREILGRIPQGSEYLFPSPSSPTRGYIKDLRPALKRIEKRSAVFFRCHDLRRTFATRASEVGIDFLMIKRLLNHRSNDITEQYIQWNSRENLSKMREALELIVY